MISRSRFSSRVSVCEKRRPIRGRSDSSGMPDLFLTTWVCVRPPITAVSPSPTRSCVVALRFGMVKPRSPPMMRSSDCSAAIDMRIWRLFVMCGVTVRMMPVSLNWTLARAGTPTCEAAPASMTRTGVSSPTRIFASRLSSVVMLGSAWMSDNCCSRSASRNAVRLYLPRAVDSRRLSAEPFLYLRDALPMPARTSPPRVIRPSRSSTDSVPGRLRGIRLLKYAAEEPRS